MTRDDAALRSGRVRGAQVRQIWEALLFAQPGIRESDAGAAAFETMVRSKQRSNLILARADAPGGPCLHCRVSGTAHSAADCTGAFVMCDSNPELHAIQRRTCTCIVFALQVSCRVAAGLTDPRKDAENKRFIPRRVEGQENGFLMLRCSKCACSTPVAMLQVITAACEPADMQVVRDSWALLRIRI